jgi:cytoskeletal protein RodZ
MLEYRRIWKGPVTISARLLRQEIAIGLIVFLTAPFGGSVPAFAQQTAPAPQQQTVPVPQISGASSSQPSSENQTQNDNPSSAPKSSQEQQSGTQAPLGTAAAPYEKGIGVAASRPAGAVIAPAKQRRTRSFVIKLGVLIGACAAVGTVVALSNASPSQPH